MAKLKDLIATVSTSYGEDESRVNVIAMGLRKARLIESSGRGLHAAEMTARDGANLLIGVMAPGAATKAAQTVRHIRASKCGWFEDQGLTKKVSRHQKLPPVAFLEYLLPRHTFGEALEALIEHFSYAGSTLDGDRRSNNISVSVILTSLDWRCEIKSQKAGGRGWALGYHNTLAVPAPEAGVRHREIKVTVQDDLLRDIARVIGPPLMPQKPKADV